MTQIVSLDFASWQPAVSPDAQQSAVRAVEGGGVLVLPHLAFTLDDHERRFLDARWSDGRAKNISLEGAALKGARGAADDLRSEEHTSELQSHVNLVCRLLLEKKKTCNTCYLV